LFLIDQLIILFLLSVVGDPLRNLFSIKITYLENLDLFQVLLLDFFLGGFIFYVIALIPFGLFTRSTVFFIIFITLVLNFIRYGRYLFLKFKAASSSFLDQLKYLFSSINKLTLGLVVILLFIILFWIESEATVGTLFGNVHDASLFSMLIKLISENGMIPTTLTPYETSGIIYPQGFSVICVFSTYILNSEPENIILFLVPLFQALTTIGAYSLGKSWGKKRSFGVFMAFIFVFVSRWPKLLVWGSYAFVAAFPLYLLILGFIPFIIDYSNWKTQKTILKLLFFGLIVGYLGSIHAVYYEVVISTIIILFIIKLYRNQNAGLHELPGLVIFLIFSLLPVSIFLHRFIVSAFLPGQNIGLPIDIIAPKLLSLQENLGTIIGHLFFSDWISPYPILRILTLVLIFASFIWMKKNWRCITLKKWKCSIEILIYSFLGIALIILLGSKETGLSFFVTAINIPETAIILFVSALLLTSIPIFENFTKIQKFLNRFFSKYASITFLAIIFTLFFTPFIFYTLQSDVKYCKGIYSFLCVTTPEDYELMKRIENKLPGNSTILINPYDAGGFLPTIASYRVVYPLTGSRASVSYNELTSLILQENLNQKFYELLDYFNISHLFVGSKAISFDGVNYLGPQEWNPLLFLANPNFNLIENVEKTYIFEYDTGD
jgi:hypothetical protein